MEYKDYFSKEASDYARYRPTYPTELFSYLSSLTADHDLAWDCATGNGQCAIKLGSFYNKVIATDPSREQIRNAFPDKKVDYRVETAENCSLKDSSIDLVVVAQALHWFDAGKFFEQVSRVVKENGILAIVSYVNPVIDPEIDALTSHLHDEVLKDYWKPENWLVFHQYRDINFPFQKLESPKFKIEKDLSLFDFTGHLRSWSAVQLFLDDRGFNPIEEIQPKVTALWGDDECKKALWDLHVLVMRVNGSGQ